jgi:hypothetical protein
VFGIDITAGPSRDTPQGTSSPTPPAAARSRVKAARKPGARREAQRQSPAAGGATVKPGPGKRKKLPAQERRALAARRRALKED